MSMEEDLVRLVRATVKAEVENHMRNRSSELIGRGGDTVVGGMGNIYLQPGANKKAFYKGVEIGTGGGGGGTITGSGTTNYIPRFIGATAIGNSHLVDDGSTITSSEDIDLLSEKAVKFYDTSSNLNGKIYADLDVEVARHFYIWASAATYIDLKSAIGSIILTAAGSIYLDPVTDIQALNNLNMVYHKITNLAAATTAGDAVRFEQALLNPLTTDLIIKEASPMLYFQDASANPLGSIGSLGGGFYIGNDVNSGSIFIRTGAIPATRVQIYDTGVALGVPLAMSSNKITGLAAATANGDALRYEQLVGVYLPLSGALGDVTTPNMGAKDIYFTDGYGIDLRNDNVHKISYASGSNSLQISTYDTCNFYFTRDSSTRLSVDYDGIRLGHTAFFRKNHAADNCYIVDDASGTMELHVASMQRLKVVIG